MQPARRRALMLVTHLMVAYARVRPRCAYATRTLHAVIQVALPYSLGQLSNWLARGGMALGALLLVGAWCSGPCTWCFGDTRELLCLWTLATF